MVKNLEKMRNKKGCKAKMASRKVFRAFVSVQKFGLANNIHELTTVFTKNIFIEDFEFQSFSYVLALFFPIFF